MWSTAAWFARRKPIRSMTTITRNNVDIVRQELETNYPNLHLVGRNGMHKYNNQDHAMMTAMLCVENILADAKLYDLWQVNRTPNITKPGPPPPRKQTAPLYALSRLGSSRRPSWRRKGSARVSRVGFGVTPKQLSVQPRIPEWDRI